MASLTVTLTSLPEEVLERILALALAPTLPSNSSTPLASKARLPWHVSVSPSSKPICTDSIPNRRTRIAPLLACRLLSRIAAPLLYHTIVLTSPTQTAALLSTLNPASDASSHRVQAFRGAVRKVYTLGCWPGVVEVLSLCPRVGSLDLTMDDGPAAPSSVGGPNEAIRNVNVPTQIQSQGQILHPNILAFCSNLAALYQKECAPDAVSSLGSTLKHLTLRKSAYLTQAGPAKIMETIAGVLDHLNALELLTLAFSPSASPSLIALSSMLAHVPSLKRIESECPSVWSKVFAEITKNPNLEAISLQPTPNRTSLFMMEAKKHPRLMELINAGTPPPPSFLVTPTSSMGGVRMRAHTIAPSIDLKAAGKGIERSHSEELDTSSPLQPSTPAFGNWDPESSSLDPYWSVGGSSTLPKSLGRRLSGF